MAIKKAPTPAELRRTAKRLVAQAGSALEDPLAAPAGYKDAKAFKAGLLKSLAAHPGFHQAAVDLHSMHLDAARLGARKPTKLVTVPVRPSGRVQASRYDPSQGQRDRQRGWRAEGGRRQGRRSHQGGKKS